MQTSLMKRHIKLSRSKRDAPFIKALAITIGGLIGGGMAFYWREKYAVKGLKEELEGLEKELEKLQSVRKEKEQQLKERRKNSDM